MALAVLDASTWCLWCVSNYCNL